MRRILFSALLVLCVSISSCGSDTTYTVGGHTLLLAEQTFGQADYFCPNLQNGQYMVVLQSFTNLCSQLNANMSSAQIFHGTTDESNLRLIFPSTMLTKIPPQNKFQVGNTDCVNTPPNGTQAIAIFSHSKPGDAKYDLSTRADSGTIVLNYPSTKSELTGTFDLTFGSDHIKGSFDGIACAKIVPGIGDDR